MISQQGIEVAWKQRVDHQGFAVIRDFISTGEIAGLLQDTREPLPRSRAGLRHALRYPSIAAFVRKPRLTALAAEILGTAATPFRATLFDKSPDANWLVVWHQDTALPLNERRETEGWGPWSVKDGVIYAHAPADALSRILALRVHLDASTVENGSLRVLPRTHIRGVLTDDRCMNTSSYR